MPVQAMAMAATRMRAPSTPLAKYSALLCPHACSSSGGRAATVSIISVTHGGDEVDDRLGRIGEEPH